MDNHLWMIVLGTFAWVAGALTARRLYGGVGKDDPLASKFPPFFALCRSKLFFLMTFTIFIKRIQDPFARFVEVIELLFISGLMVPGSAGIAGIFALIGKACYIGKFMPTLFGSFWEPWAFCSAYGLFGS